MVAWNVASVTVRHENSIVFYAVDLLRFGTTSEIPKMRTGNISSGRFLKTMLYSARCQNYSTLIGYIENTGIGSSMQSNLRNYNKSDALTDTLSIMFMTPTAISIQVETVVINHTGICIYLHKAQLISLLLFSLYTLFLMLSGVRDVRTWKA